MTALPLRENTQLPEHERGQAMVEFALILLILMAMTVGMVHIARLLTYDYWAQQEARFLAFEQTWVPASYYEETGESPHAILNDGQYFRRPRTVERLDVTKEASDEGGLSTIIASLFDDASTTTSVRDNSSRAEPFTGSTLLARRQGGNADSIWHRTSAEWWDSIKQRGSLVSVAYAGLTGSVNTLEQGHQMSAEEQIRGIGQPHFSQDSLETGMQQILDTVDFGESFCAGMRDVFGKHAFQPGVQAFSHADCGQEYNSAFALHIAENLDVKGVFRDYAYQIDTGVSHHEAIDYVVEHTVTNQFYSFFDTAVAIARIGTVPYILGIRAEKALGGSLDDVVRMVSEARYVGSSVAVLAISGGQLAQILGHSPASRDVDAEKSLQDAVFSVLHADVPDISYGLSPLYLPVPPTFLGGMSALQNAAMENVLRGGENAVGDFLSESDSDDSDLIDPLINDSNKLALVRYDSGKGMFPAAARKFKSDTTLTSRFFLVTQPWHITRKESPLGGFRDIGTETDRISDNTEEAVLRRRVAGLWLFPSAPSAFFRAPFEYFDAGGISGALDAVSGLDSAIGTIKSLLIDNPILTLFDTLSDIPLIGGLVPTIPKFPVVRPAAYPNSIELRDQDHSPDDELSGSKRNFSDYVDEQDYNPKPKPKFDNDTFD